MEAWRSAAVEGLAWGWRKLFFKRRPADCRTSIGRPSPLAKMKAR